MHASDRWEKTEGTHESQEWLRQYRVILTAVWVGRALSEFLAIAEQSMQQRDRDSQVSVCLTPFVAESVNLSLQEYQSLCLQADFVCLHPSTTVLRLAGHQALRVYEWLAQHPFVLDQSERQALPQTTLNLPTGGSETAECLERLAGFLDGKPNRCDQDFQSPSREFCGVCHAAVSMKPERYDGSQCECCDRVQLVTQRCMWTLLLCEEPAWNCLLCGR